MTPPRTLTEIRAERAADAAAGRRLPDSRSPLWDDADTVWELAFWSDTVSPAAHALAHKEAVAGCPGCPPGGVVVPRVTEQSWREIAVRRARWSA